MFRVTSGGGAALTTGYSLVTLRVKDRCYFSLDPKLAQPQAFAALGEKDFSSTELLANPSQPLARWRSVGSELFERTLFLTE